MANPNDALDWTTGTKNAKAFRDSDTYKAIEEGGVDAEYVYKNNLPPSDSENAKALVTENGLLDKSNEFGQTWLKGSRMIADFYLKRLNATHEGAWSKLKNLTMPYAIEGSTNLRSNIDTPPVENQDPNVKPVISASLSDNMSDEEIAQFGLELMGMNEHNFLFGAGTWADSDDYPPEILVAMAGLADLYSKLPDFTWTGTKRLTKGLFTDPTTYAAGLGSLKVVKELLKGGSKQFGKHALRNKLLAKALGSSFVGVEGAGYAAMFDMFKQKMEAGDQPFEYDYGRMGQNAAIGFGAATTLTGGLLATPAAVKGGKKLLGKAGDLIDDLVGDGAVVRSGVGPTDTAPTTEIAPPFYSAVAKAVDDLPQEKGKPWQMKAMIENTAGVKKEEMAWIGLDEFLKGGNKTITKQEIKDFVAANQVRIEEVTKRSIDGDDAALRQSWDDGVVDDGYDAYSPRVEDLINEINNNNDFYTEDIIRYMMSANKDKYPGLQMSGLVNKTWANEIRDQLKKGGIDNLDPKYRSDFEEAIETLAKNQYMENPYRTYTDNNGYKIYGNDDVGYQIINPEGNSVSGINNPVYNLEEAKIQAYQDALDEGLISGGDADFSGGATRFEDWTLPGGENYREVLLRLPETQGRGISDAELARLDELTDKRVADGLDGLTDAERDEYLSLVRKREDKGQFLKGHFDETNVLAHVRLNDRTGPNGEKILFVEEIQSDWHQMGRKRGYKIPLEKLNEQTRNDYLRMVELERRGPRNTAEENTEYYRLEEKYGGDFAKSGILASEKIIGTIPDAPLKKTWHEMAFRRIARMAAEEGYDVVSWTPGNIQADRYNLRNNVDEIVVGNTDVGDLPANGRDVIIRDKNGGSFHLWVTNEGLVDEVKTHNPQFRGKKLDEIVGKEMANKILNVEKPEKFTGDGLPIGGEGMKTFYDKMVKKYAEKFGKKFGAKVETTDLVNIERQLGESVDTGVPLEQMTDAQLLDELGYSKEGEVRTKVWSMKITQKMRDSLLKKGVPLFGTAGTAGAIGMQQGEGEPATAQ